MLIWSNEANGKITGDTHVTPYRYIQDFWIKSVPDGVEIKADLGPGGSIVKLITEPSYDEAVARVKAIQRAFLNGLEEYDMRVLQLHPG